MNKKVIYLPIRFARNRSDPTGKSIDKAIQFQKNHNFGLVIDFFYQQFTIELAKHPLVLATVIQVSGSVPREAGAKMLICSDRRTIGTIGGGTGEAKVIQQALMVLKTNTQQFVEIDLSGEPGRETDGACGGTMRVWLERWDKTRLPLVEKIIFALENGEPVAIVTPFDQAPYLLSESIAAPYLTATGCFVEPIEPPPILLIVGAGHIGFQLARIAHIAGFQVVVSDDRPDLITIKRFPNAVLLTTSIDLALQRMSCARSRYVALVTRSIEQTINTLKVLQDYTTHYIGMIGSHNRIQHIFQALVNSNNDQEDNTSFLETIHTPIGLEIGAQTPEEIAISICAELIQARRGSTAQKSSHAESVF
jgi:xanthine dehydrogenase accessory factor